MARRLGRPLLPHQRHIVDVGLELDPDTGRLAYNQVWVIGPRQATGKTSLVLPVGTHRCLGFGPELVEWVRRELGARLRPPGPQTVLYTAQTADKAREKWRKVHWEGEHGLKGSVFAAEGLVRARLRLNAEALEWRNGSSWSPGSTTGKTGGTGDTLDLGFIDEAWSRPDSRTELGMLPAMMTRDWRQLWGLSMIPGSSRARPDEWPYLRAKRRLGRQRVAAGSRSGMAFFDFTAAGGPDDEVAPNSADPADPDTWYSCMPGLGFTVREETVAEDFASMDLVDFCAEYLGWEPLESQPRWVLMPQLVWADRCDPSSRIAGDLAYGIEFSEDRTRAWIGAAGWRADGGVHVEVVEPGQDVPDDVQGVDWVERRLPELVGRNPAVATVVRRDGAANSLVVPLRNRGIEVLTPGLQEVAAACGRFYDATGAARPAGADGEVADPVEEQEGLRLWHIGQQSLDSALGRSRRYDLGGGSFVFIRRGGGSAGEVGPLNTVVLGLHGLVVKGTRTPEPDIFV